MKKIKSYPNYSCDKQGNVYSPHRKLKQSKRGNGYLCVTICNEYGRKTRNVHRLIIETFISNPDNKQQVNHKNGIKNDNRIENLEWVTQSENTIHAIENGLYKLPKQNRKDLSKPIKQYSLDGIFIKNYPSVNEAARELVVSTKWLCACANGGTYRISGGVKKWVNCNSANGYKWKYI